MKHVQTEARVPQLVDYTSRNRRAPAQYIYRTRCGVVPQLLRCKLQTKSTTRQENIKYHKRHKKRVILFFGQPNIHAESMTTRLVGGTTCMSETCRTPTAGTTCDIFMRRFGFDRSARNAAVAGSCASKPGQISHTWNFGGCTFGSTLVRKKLAILVCMYTCTKLTRYTDSGLC